MRLEIRFDNLEEVKAAYDPATVEKAAYSTVKQLHSKAATQVSKAVRKNYKITAGAIRAKLQKRVMIQNGIPSGFLIYTSPRLSLRHFSYTAGGVPTSRGRPKVKTAKGTRYGARSQKRKTGKIKVHSKAFWGHGRVGTEDAAGSWQIFERIGLGRLKIRKLTGPGISQMVRSKDALEAVETLVQNEADKMLAHNLDHFLQKQIGTR